MSVAEPLRIPDSELDYDENLVYYHNGYRFTGIAFESHVSCGVSEIEYRDGVQEGTARDWDLSGRLVAQSEYRANALHGHVQEFDSLGGLVLSASYEFGILVSFVKKDSAGDVIESFEIDPASPNYSLLQEYRETQE